MRCPMLPLFRETEGNIDAYLQRFARYALNEGWDRGCYAVYLSALLEGPALETYHRMPIEDANNYDALKTALLRKYSLTEGDFRKRFYNCRQAPIESAPQFLSRLKHYLFQWIEMARIEPTFEALRDLLLREQFLHSCPKDLSLFLRERSAKDLSAITEWAEIFAESRASLGIKPPRDFHVGKPPSTPKPSPAAAPPAVDARYSRPPYCFSCNQVGHKAPDCPSRKPRPGLLPLRPVFRKQTGSIAVRPNVDQPSAPHVCSNHAVLECGCEVPVHVGCTAFITQRPRRMRGLVNGKSIRAIRDTGCSTVIIRKSLVEPAQLTGKMCKLVLVDGTAKSYPLARCMVDTPVYTGEVVAVCVLNPICDVVIVNIPGTHSEDMKWRRHIDFGREDVKSFKDQTDEGNNRATTPKEETKAKVKKRVRAKQTKIGKGLQTSRAERPKRVADDGKPNRDKKGSLAPRLHLANNPSDGDGRSRFDRRGWYNRVCQGGYTYNRNDGVLASPVAISGPVSASSFMDQDQDRAHWKGPYDRTKDVTNYAAESRVSQRSFKSQA